VGLVRDRSTGWAHLFRWRLGVWRRHVFRRVRDRYGPLELAILPIGAYEPRWFMRDQHKNPAEAVQALLDCGAETALASHYGTFQLTDEAIDAPPLVLADALNAAGVPPEQFRVLRPGQVWHVKSMEF
jgi:L-ascorbate metabolism protein UlaG (beta-lactamase superfamily)